MGTTNEVYAPRRDARAVGAQFAVCEVKIPDETAAGPCADETRILPPPTEAARWRGPRTRTNQSPSPTRHGALASPHPRRSCSPRQLWPSWSLWAPRGTWGNPAAPRPPRRAPARPAPRL